MFTEDMGAFFQATEFAVTATFSAADGGAPVSAQVIFNAQTEVILGEAVLSNEYTIVYPATALPGIRGGDYGTVNGVEYRMRDVKLKGDGALKIATLSKV